MLIKVDRWIDVGSRESNRAWLYFILFSATDIAGFYYLIKYNVIGERSHFSNKGVLLKN